MVIARFWIPTVLVSVSQTAQQRHYSIVHRILAELSEKPKHLQQYEGVYAATACGRNIVGVTPLKLADKQTPRRCVPCFKSGAQVGEVDRWTLELVGAEGLY
jgi:hypothetical protein